ncbi:MAG: SagB/ThcOx family dehydrogenase, partial [Thermodesulfobacteriota bacterium]
EAALCLVRLGEARSQDRAAPPAAAPAEDALPQATPAARIEAVFGLIAAAARLTSAPLAGADQPGWPWPEHDGIELAPADWKNLEGPTLVQALQKRRSRRNFRPKTITRLELARLLELVRTGDTGRVIELGFLTNEVQDLPDGFYLFRPDRGLARHKGGFLGPHLAEAALGQDWVGRANVVLVVSAGLEALEATLGPRSLRLAYLAAGRLGQRAYLAAEVLGWGCCGVGAFFDEEVAGLLDLPAGLSPLYLIPLGPVQKRIHGGRAAANRP